MEWRWRCAWTGGCGLVVLALVPLAATTGCGGSKLDTVPVTGKVTYQGSPAPWGVVRFRPATRMSGRPAMADIQVDGSYEVGTLADTKGLAPGQYKITVFVSKTPALKPTAEQTAAAAKLKLPIPARYTDPEKSGLTLTISPDDGPTVFDIELTD